MRLRMSGPFPQRQKLGQSGTTSAMRDLATEPLACFARANPPTSIWAMQRPGLTMAGSSRVTGSLVVRATRTDRP